MVFRISGADNRARIRISIIFVIISIFVGISSYGIPGMNLVFPLVSLITVLSAAVWFGRNGIITAVLLGGFILFTSFFRSGSVTPYAVTITALLLSAGWTIALLSERVRIQRNKEVPFIDDGPEQIGSMFRHIGSTLGIVHYCILPYVNVQRMKEKKDIRGLIRALTCDDIKTQYSATEALGTLRDPGALTALVHVLREDRYSAVRWKAAEALARMGEPAVDPLIVALGHGNDDVRWKAAIALGDIGDPRAIEPLVVLLGDKDSYVRGRAAYALSMIGQPAVPALIRVLEDGTTESRPGAISALGKINDPRAIAPLIRALGDVDERVRSEAMASLEHAETHVIDRFLTVLGEAGAAELRNLSADNQPGPGARTLVFPENIAHADSDLRMFLAEALKKTGDLAFEPLINDLLSNRKEE